MDSLRTDWGGKEVRCIPPAAAIRRLRCPH